MREERVQGIPHAREAYDAYIAFGRQWKQFNELYRKAALSSGLSDSAFEIFFALYDLGEGCLQRDICAYCYASKQTINSSIHKLKKEGLIRLESADSGRGMRIYFTPAGKALADARVSPFAHADLRVFSELGKEACEHLVAMQGKYLADLEANFDALYESAAQSVQLQKQQALKGGK